MSVPSKSSKASVSVHILGLQVRVVVEGRLTRAVVRLRRFPVMPGTFCNQAMILSNVLFPAPFLLSHQGYTVLLC